MFANYLCDLVGQSTSGRRAGCKLSRRVQGAHYDDLLNIINNWMKNIVWWATFLLTSCVLVTRISEVLIKEDKNGYSSRAAPLNRK